MPVERDLTEILRLAFDELREQIHTSLPGTVQTFYPLDQTADVVLAVQRPIVDPTTGLKTFETFPALPKVPIAYPRGGGFAVAFPLAAGDEVTVVFRMYSDADWRSTGQLSSPTDATAHGLYAVAIPCSTLPAKALADPVTDHLVIGRAGHSEQIRIPQAGGEIDLGAAPTDHVALAAFVDAVFGALQSWVPVPNDGGAALKTLITAALTGYTTVAATLVKAQ